MALFERKLSEMLLAPSSCVFLHSYQTHQVQYTLSVHGNPGKKDIPKDIFLFLYYLSLINSTGNPFPSLVRWLDINELTAASSSVKLHLGIAVLSAKH